MENSKSFIMAERLKCLRKGKGLSHESLSKALKDKYNVTISKDSLINYEVTTEHRTKKFANEGMRVSYLRVLADYFDVSSDYILGLTEDPAPRSAAVDELGLKPIVVQEICKLATLSGYYDSDDTFDSPLQALNVFLYNSLITPLYEMINCLYRAIEEEKKAEDSNNSLLPDHFRYYAEGNRGNRDQAIEHAIYFELIELHPELRGKIELSYGSRRLKPLIDEICDLFRKTLEEMTGYKDYINKQE